VNVIPSLLDSWKVVCFVCSLFELEERGVRL
jgi:hypothetical protein